MVVRAAAKRAADSPKQVASLIDLANLPSTLREFVGQSQISRLGCFIRVWSYIKDHNLQVVMVGSLNRHRLCSEKLLSSDGVPSQKFGGHSGDDVRAHALEDPNNKNIVKCDGKLKSILLGKDQIELAELPALIKLHFPKQAK